MFVNLHAMQAVRDKKQTGREKPHGAVGSYNEARAKLIAEMMNEVRPIGQQRS